ncbi:MAG: hypothetical protein ACOXZO_07310 [Bacteroidales bacterium]|nr:hypothetical protein [Bacteroidales bacterium]
MKQLFLSLLAVFILSSCATLIHQPFVNINVHSDLDSVKIRTDANTDTWHDTPVRLNTIRSKNDLFITAKKDSLQKTFQIKSTLSTAFWLGNLFSGVGVIGYALDLTNPKRFTYPNYITINFDQANNTLSTRYYKWLAPAKNLLSVKISVPEGNYLYLNKGKGYGHAFGFLGISGGLEYYITDRHSLNIDVGTLTDFMLPVPAPVDYMGSYNSSFASYGDFQIGSDFQRIHYDCGLQFNRTQYYERETVELFPNYIDTLKYSAKQNNIGLALSAYYRISNGFNLGINYYPSFFSWGVDKLNAHYSHLLFFELVFRIEAIKPKRKK